MQSLREALDARVAVDCRPTTLALVQRCGGGGVHRGSVEVECSGWWSIGRW
jgi:hypothetical protein